jgi:hypothetical protein
MMRFDPAVILFWIGGSILNVLFGLCVLIAATEYLALTYTSDILYMLTGFVISFFTAVVVYLIVQVMANGILDAKAAKDLLKAVLVSPETKTVIGTICRKLGIMDPATVDRVYEKVKERIVSASYDELTPDEVLIVSKAIEESKVSGP